MTDSPTGAPRGSGGADWLDRTFRFNPAFEFVPFERLTPADWRQLGAERPDPEMAGVLMPLASALSAKTLCAGAAALVTDLRRPGLLPAEARAEFTRDPATLCRLVMDAILEVEEGGAFVSGPAAASLLALRTPPAEPRHPLARLSLRALRYGEALEIWRPSALSARMYFYNRIPAGPGWRRRAGWAAGVEHFLGIGAGAGARRMLERDWTPADAPPDNPGWLFWRSRAGRRGRSPFKLYLSPHPDELADVLRIALPLLAEAGAPGLKIGRDLHGILRPDKLVVYLPGEPALRSVGAALGAALAGFRAQGVPFTAPLDDGSLLSWGMDPPRKERFSSWQGTSWRRWVTDRLAVALVQAKSAPDPAGEPWRFALERIRMEGVDPVTWTPGRVTWRQDVDARD